VSATSRTSRAATLVGAGAGLAAAAVALGTAELVAALDRAWRSPVLDVGDGVIDRVPPFVKDVAISTFGTNDKPALLVGIGVVVAAYAALVGALAFRRRFALGAAGIALVGVVGASAVLTRRAGADLIDVVPTVVGCACGIAALAVARGAARPLLAAPPMVGDDAAPSPSPSGPITSRRDLVRAASVLGVLVLSGGGAAAIGRALARRFSAAESRADVSLPMPRAPLAPAPAGVEVGVDGVAPFFTPNRGFYRMDTALTVPQVPTDGYELTVTGMVDRTLRLNFDDLLAREVVEHDITMTCVSNTIGGELVGNARWLGVRLDDLLAEAGPRADADQVVGRSVDGYTCGFPLQAATDGRHALVAFGMNGEPLPLEHGFPVRLVVPGLYGYCSATKWLTEIELTRFDRFRQYWVPRGYAEQAPIKLMSRIDSVDGLGRLRRSPDGVATIGGVAWAQTRGISGVEVQIDEGRWEPAELGVALNDDTWRDPNLPDPFAAGHLDEGCVSELTGDGATGVDTTTDPTGWTISYAQGGGGMTSTLPDLGSWADSNSGNSFLSDGLQTARLVADSPIGGPENYGLGIFEIGDNWYGHAGEAIGWQTLVLHDPDSGVSLAFASNTCNGEDLVYWSILDELYPNPTLDEFLTSQGI
jgi:DMSO/TMAO reductase YedYZ molybdopterin-dependent catalytic subunit